MRAFDAFKDQLPDIDPEETAEWITALDQVIDQSPARAAFLLHRILRHAQLRRIGVPAMVTTHYINTIPPEEEHYFPGDEDMERRIRRLVRWNAAAMVARANKHLEGIGGHISTYASSAALFEVGFKHFFRGKNAPGGGDHVYFQGHAAPGIYARAFLEGRWDDEKMDRFRQEALLPGLSSYPHPRLMPEFWEFPTVSMGLSPLNAIYQARFNRYLQNRGIKDTSGQRVWAFVGDGEMDEPESMAALSLAAREGLDNLIFIVNCNLQRLDGPVRGDGKIIQELESIFRGAGWHVIKVILAHTIKGWTLPGTFEGRNVTHQMKKLSVEELKIFRDRLELPIKDQDLESGEPPYFHPGMDTPEIQYMLARRHALGGVLPERRVVRKPVEPAAAGVYEQFSAGSEQPVSTTMAYIRLM